MRTITDAAFTHACENMPDCVNVECLHSVVLDHRDIIIHESFIGWSFRFDNRGVQILHCPYCGQKLDPK